MAQRRSLLIPVTVVFSILGGGNAIVFYLLASHLSGNFSGTLTCCAVLFYVLQIAAPLIQLRARQGQTQSRWSEKLQWTAYAALGVLSILFTIAVGLEVLAWIANLATRYRHGELIDTLWVWAMALLGGGLSLLGLYQASRGLRTVFVDVVLDGLAKEFSGYRIVQISDLHVSSLIGRRYTKMVVDRVNGLDADMVVMTGDFIDGTVEPLRYRVAPLEELKSRDGRYFITGNHEYYYGAEAWVEEHRRLGTVVLLNEHRVIERGNAKIVIAGVTDRSGGAFIESHRQDIGRALADAPQGAIKILLAHQPGCYGEAEAKGVDLQLSGHTHGGQFFPWQFAVKIVHRYSQGLYRHGRMWLYVNPGTGFWGPPLRATVPPEITVITLKSVAK